MSTRDSPRIRNRLPVIQLLELIIWLWTALLPLYAQNIVESTNRSGEQVTPSPASLASAEQGPRSARPKLPIGFEDEKKACLDCAAQGDAVGAATHYRKLIRIASQASDGVVSEEAGEGIEMCRAKLPPAPIHVPPPKDYNENDLMKELRTRLKPEELPLVVNPLVATPEMERRAHELAGAATNDVQKARKLYEVLSQSLNPQSLTGPGRRRTASEVFVAWTTHKDHFSCEDLAYLYVALARSVGLRAYVADVAEDCYGSTTDHACAAIFLSHEAFLVDTIYGIFGVLHLKFTVLSDLQTVAVYLCELRALTPCKTASKLAPNLPMVRLNLFVAFTTEGLWDEAEREATYLSQLDPDGPKTAWAEAKVALHKGKAEEACTLLTAAVRKAPESGRLYELLGQIYAQQGNVQQARRCYESALRYSADNESKNWLRLAIASNDAYAWYLNGWERSTNSDFDGALTNYNRALELDPRLAAAYAGRGDVLQRKGDLEGALTNYNKALELDPRLAAAYDARAHVEQMKGVWAAALLDYGKAIELNPRDAEAYVRRGDTMQKKGDLKGALADYNKAIAIKPDWARAFENRGVLKGTKGDMAGAVADFDRALLLEPNMATAYGNRAYAKRVIGDLDGAFADLNAALRLEPDLSKEVAPEFVALGWLHYCHQNFHAALTNAQRASELSKSDDGAQLFIWLARSRLGELDAATKELKLYLDGRPEEKSATWPFTIEQFVLGRLAEQDLLQVAQRADQGASLQRQCAAYFYAGVKRLALNDPPGAKKYFEQCLDTGATACPEYSAATAELKWLPKNSRTRRPESVTSGPPTSSAVLTNLEPRR